MKKVYLGGEQLLSSLSPVLKSPDKGVDIIPNTLPFPGHISEDAEVRQQSLCCRMTSKFSPDKFLTLDAMHFLCRRAQSTLGHFDYLVLIYQAITSQMEPNENLVRGHAIRMGDLNLPHVKRSGNSCKNM